VGLDLELAQPTGRLDVGQQLDLELAVDVRLEDGVGDGLQLLGGGIALGAGPLGAGQRTRDGGSTSSKTGRAK
jgi:hypothetical protein